MRTVVGQDLQKLFAAHEDGRIDRTTFENRKALLLDWSGCRLSRFTPRALQFRDTGPPAAIGT